MVQIENETSNTEGPETVQLTLLTRKHILELTFKKVTVCYLPINMLLKDTDFSFCLYRSGLSYAIIVNH